MEDLPTEFAASLRRWRKASAEEKRAIEDRLKEELQKEVCHASDARSRPAAVLVVDGCEKGS